MAKSANENPRSMYRIFTDLSMRFAPDAVGEVLSDAALGVAQTTTALTRNLATLAGMAPAAPVTEDRVLESIGALQKTVARLTHQVNDLSQQLEGLTSRPSAKARSSKPIRSRKPTRGTSKRRKIRST
jgi:prophage DNA circulation protein